MNLTATSRSFSWAQKAWPGSCLRAWWNQAPVPCSLVETSAVFQMLHRLGHGPALLVACLLAAAPTVTPLPWSTAGILLLAAATAYGLPGIATATLPFFLLWAPKLSIAGTGNEVVFVRIDHALVLAILLRALQEKTLRTDRVLLPIVAFIMATCVSIITGTLSGTLNGAVAALFYLIQLLYLSGIFIAASTYGTRFPKLGIYSWAYAILTITAYGIAEMIHPVEGVPDGVYRTYERFYFDGQANHVAGLLACGTVTGLALMKTARWRGLGLVLAISGPIAMLGTHSREGFIALAVMLASFVLLPRPRVFLTVLVVTMVAGVMTCGPVLNALAVPGSSFFDRVLNWHAALEAFSHHPLVGLGLGAWHRNSYDNQYIMWLTETGLIGTIVFALWILVLLRKFWQNRNQPGVAGALGVGAFCALAGISVQGLAAVVFIVTILAGPLYWLLGLACAHSETPS